MNLESPRCRRCGWGAFFHVLAMREPGTVDYAAGDLMIRWPERPVRAEDDRALGHFLRSTELSSLGGPYR